MQKYSIWEDAIYSTTGTTYLHFNILDGNSNVIYSGKAYPRPTNAIVEINVSQIVRNYLNSQLPVTAFSGRTFNEGVCYLPNALMDFTLGDEKGNVLETYKFLNCWDYQTRFEYIDNSGMAFGMNHPVNNHTAAGQYTFTSVLTKTNQMRVTIGTSSGNSCGYGVLYYSNAIGGWDMFLIEGNMKKKNTYERYDIQNNYKADSLQFGHRTINNTIVESWELQTQYLTDEESKILTTNLFGSNNVYFHDLVENKIYPVVLTDTSVEVKNWKNQGKKHFLYKINIKSAQDKQRI